jgi:hypothetical protein
VNKTSTPSAQQRLGFTFYGVQSARRGAADRGQHRQTAGVGAQRLKAGESLKRVARGFLSACLRAYEHH